MVVEGAAGVAYAGMTKAISGLRDATLRYHCGNVPQSVFVT